MVNMSLLHLWVGGEEAIAPSSENLYTSQEYKKIITCSSLHAGSVSLLSVCFCAMVKL